MIYLLLLSAFQACELDSLIKLVRNYVYNVATHMIKFEVN